MRRFLWRLRAMFRREDLDAELEHHLEMERHAALARGLSETEARRQAALRAGNLTGAREAVREARGIPFLDGFAADVRHAFRSLRRSPGYLAAALAALAAAVAINTLVFFLLDGILLRPLPYPEPGRLIRVYEAGPKVQKWPLSISNFEEFQRSARSLESIALYTGADVELNKQRVPGIAVTPDFFPLLGAVPHAGRFFTLADMTRATRVVILSHAIWRTHFHGDPGIIGKAIRMNRESWTVAGIAPAGFQHIGGDYRSPVQGETVGVWIPLPLDGSEMRRKASHFSNAVARLRPDATAESARLELRAIAGRIAKEDPRFSEGLQANAVPLLDEVAGRSKQVVYLLAAAAFLVMCIACANVAGLCVARAVARSREFEIRHALGAGRWQLLRAGLAENLILGLAGSAAGLILAAAALPLLRAVLPADFPRLHEIHVTPAAAAFAVAAGLAASAAAGMIPRWSRPVTRLRAWLVAGEVALAVLLCAGGLLLARSYERLGERDHGFTPSNVQTFQISFPGPAYSSREKLAGVSRRIREEIDRVPGVLSSGLGTDLPWSGWDENSSWGLPGDSRETFSGRFHMASPGYFESIGTRLIAGRYFDEREYSKQPLSVIVNEALVNKYLEGTKALGRKISVWGEPREIVGIVADVRDNPADGATAPAYWFPDGQVPFGQLSAAVKANSLVINAVRDAIASVDPELPVANVRSLEEHAARALASRRFALWLFQSFAAMALALASIGVYGLLSYTVQQRRREIGIRMALGATRTTVWTMVVRDGVRIAAIGALLGAALVPLCARLIAGFLFGVAPADPLTLLLAPAVLLVAAFLATLVPARQATRCEPAAALRHQ